MNTQTTHATHKSNSHRDILLTLGIMVAMIISITTWWEQSPELDNPTSISLMNSKNSFDFFSLRADD